LTDAVSPSAGPLVQATNGDFYGATNGGDNNRGTTFKMTPSGKLTTLYNFCSQGSFPNCPDGASPTAGLVQAVNGDFYGTTFGGGASDVCYGGCGTVFRITRTGVLTTLYSFCSQSGCTDGENPPAGLVHPTTGDLYGTTYYGGASLCPGGCGTVFSLSAGALSSNVSFRVLP
jgi:uncharacterized repeat protein (TIGR03803 family)